MQLIAQKLLPPTSVPTLSSDQAKEHVYQLGVKCCPSMDLVATYPVLARKSTSSDTSGTNQDSESEDDNIGVEEHTAATYGYNDDGEEGEINVEVWRFNGQRVFKVTIENEDGDKTQVKSVEWRHDGQILAVLAADNTIRLVNSFSGKVVHRFSSLPTYAAPPSPTSPRTRRGGAKVETQLRKSRPTALSYTTHFSNPSPTDSLLRSATDERSVVLDDLLSLNANIPSLLKSPADLPRELANIDVESFLPRLSCLPPVGFGGEDVFSTRTSVDAIFHASKKNIQSGNIDVLVAGHNDGMPSIRIFDSFEVGVVNLSNAAGMRKTLHMGRLIKMAGWPFTSEIFLTAEDTKRSSMHVVGLDLKFITQNSTTLPILATKATQLQNLLRYLTQIQTQLAREVNTAFDLPARFLRVLNEDLESQDGSGASFKTAAHRSIVTGETTGVFKGWLSEQVGDRGVKRWEKSVGDCLELTRRLVSEAWCPAVERAGIVVSRLSGLISWTAQSEGGGNESSVVWRLVKGLEATIDVMAICGEECLKQVIQEMAKFTSFIKWLKWEVEASTLEDTSEKLDEMREGADHSDIVRVLEYIQKGPDRSAVKGYLSDSLPRPEVNEEDGAEFYTSFTERRKRQGTTVPTVTFEQLLGRMRRQCDRLFEQIAHKLQKEIITRYITPLSSEIDKQVMDLRVIPCRANQARIHLISRTTNNRANIIHQVIGTGEAPSKAVHQKHPPEAQVVLDVKFVDDLHFMVLVKTAEDVKIYSSTVDTEDETEWEIRHRFIGGTMESGMRPARLEINGRKNRRVVDVIDADGKGFVIFDLDSGDVDVDEET